jgi:hypothetical protein
MTGLPLATRGMIQPPCISAPTGQISLLAPANKTTLEVRPKIRRIMPALILLAIYQRMLRYGRY